MVCVVFALNLQWGFLVISLSALTLYEHLRRNAEASRSFKITHFICPLSLCPSVLLSVCLPLCFICLSILVCLSVCRFLCPPRCLSVCCHLSVYDMSHRYIVNIICDTHTHTHTHTPQKKKKEKNVRCQRWLNSGH